MTFEIPSNPGFESKSVLLQIQLLIRMLESNLLPNF